MIDDDLLIIGRQVQTDHGGFLDLLCMDVAGDLVVLELKRDKTPRDITAQAIDYASWVAELSLDRIEEITARYYHRSLEEVFREQFDAELPETVNSDHRMLIVAAAIDSSSERIIHYLSEHHGVGINAVTFQHFRDGEDGLLSRVFLVEPEEVDHRTRTRGGSRRKPNLTPEQLAEQADQAGVSQLYEHAIGRFEPLFDRRRTTRTSLTFVGRRQGRKKAAMLNLSPVAGPDAGLEFQVYASRVCTRFGITRAELENGLTRDAQPWEYHTGAAEDWRGFQGLLRTEDDVDRLAEALQSDGRGGGGATPEES